MHKFTGQDTQVSKNIHKNAYLNYVNRTNKNTEHQPFGRNIDLWMMSYCVAIKLKLKPKSIETPTANAIPATAWSNNETLEHIVKLTLINEINEEDIIDKLNDMHKLANEYSAAGMSYILEKITEDPDKTPLDNILETARKLIAE